MRNLSLRGRLTITFVGEKKLTVLNLRKTTFAVSVGSNVLIHTVGYTTLIIIHAQLLGRDLSPYPLGKYVFNNTSRK